LSQETSFPKSMRGRMARFPTELEAVVLARWLGMLADKD
jgi:hypothetical protein